MPYILRLIMYFRREWQVCSDETDHITIRRIPATSRSQAEPLRALLDTGAYIPVWVDDESILTDVLGATLVKEDIEFTGFGGKATGNLYRMTLQIGSLIYPNMSIIANSDLDVPFNLILSATMFQNLIYEIDDRNKKLNITVPDDESLIRNLRIIDVDGKIHVLCSSLEDKNTSKGL